MNPHGNGWRADCRPAPGGPPLSSSPHDPRNAVTFSKGGAK